MLRPAELAILLMITTVFSASFVNLLPARTMSDKNVKWKAIALIFNATVERDETCDFIISMTSP